MKFLLDTHALLWWWTDDPKLSTQAKELIADSPQNSAVDRKIHEKTQRVRLGF